MTGYINRASQITPTGGTGSPLALTGAASSNLYQTWQSASAVDAQDYDYVITDPTFAPNDWELANGVFSSAAGGSITRVTVQSCISGVISTSPMNLSGAAVISQEPCARALNSIGQASVTRALLVGLSTYTFSGFSQLFNDLELLVVGRSNVAALTAALSFQVNGLSTGIYNEQRAYYQTTTGTADNALAATSISPVTSIAGNSAIGSMVGHAKLEIYDYPGISGLEKDGWFWAMQPNSGANRSMYQINGAVNILLTAPITSISLSIASGTFMTGSYAQLRLK